MTKDDIIKLAREAAAKRGHTFREVPQVETVEFLEAFFLMASEAEREECAKLCENNEPNDFSNDDRGNIQLVRHALCFQLARKIRARKNHD